MTTKIEVTSKAIATGCEVKAIMHYLRGDEERSITCTGRGETEVEAIRVLVESKGFKLAITTYLFSHFSIAASPTAPAVKKGPGDEDWLPDSMTDTAPPDAKARDAAYQKRMQAEGKSSKEPIAEPGAMNLAMQENIQLWMIDNPTGPEGIITEADVRRAMQRRNAFGG